MAAQRGRSPGPCLTVVGACRAGWLGLAALLGLVLGTVAADAASLPGDPPAGERGGTAGRCVPWPDEPDPLPDVSSPDPILAHWARRRAARLADEALALEAISPGQADRLWERVRCLDPSLPAVVQSVPRPGPLGPGDSPLPAVSAEPPVQGHTGPAAPGFPWDTWPLLLTLPGAPAQPEPSVAATREPDLTDVDQELGEIDSMVQEAQFRTALSVAEGTRALLEQAGDTPAAHVRRVRLEVLCATAAVALGREEEARGFMMTALRYDPDLQLDETTTSPKVMALLGDARAAALAGDAGGTLP